LCLSIEQVRICLGLYAGKGFTNPLKSRSAGRYQLIEVTDNATMRRNRAKIMASVLNAVCPHPIRFKQVWHLSRNGKTLYAWKPFPPEGTTLVVCNFVLCMSRHMFMPHFQSTHTHKV
jgi:hypothetical protein